MEPYLVDVSEILHDLAVQVELSGPVELGEIQAGDRTFLPTGPATLHGAVINAGDGVVLTGEVRASLSAECSRCLEPFVLEITGTLEGLYTTPEKATELPEGQEWEPVGTGVIDLAPAIEAAVRIELPFAPLHDPECLGICPECGCDRNVEACECGAGEELPGPFDALKSLFPDDETTGETGGEGT